MRILYLVNNLDPESGGWGRFSLELLNGLRDKGVEVEVISELDTKRDDVEQGLGRSWKAITSAVLVRDWIKKKNIDVIHSMETNPYAISAYIGNLGVGKKHVITANGAYSVRPLYQPLTRYITKKIYESASITCPISKYVDDEIRKKVPNLKSKVIRLGVDPEKFSGERFEPNEPFILSVGNLIKRKGYLDSIKAFAEVAKKNKKLRYKIAGSKDNEFYEECLRVAEEGGVSNRIDFLGSLSDKELKKLYLSAELFILTSINYDFHFEGFGLVFLEAATAGLPVIGTRGNGIGDAMSENNNGLLVDQHDFKGAADAIEKIINNPELKKKFSLGSLKLAKESTWDRTVEEYLGVYKEITE